MSIAQGMKNIAEDIEISSGERMSWLADFIKDTHQTMGRIHRENTEAAEAVAKLLAHFRGDHKAMAKALDAFLDKSESTRMADFKGMLSSIQSRQKGREKEVALLIKRFEDELSEMTTKTKALLSQSESKRLAEFKRTLAAIKSRQRAREEETADLLAAFQKDIGESRRHWENLAKIMAAKRAGKRVPLAQVPKKVKEAAKEAFGWGELKVKALPLIEESPQGINLRQLSSKLKVHYIRLARPIKELLDEGKVIKKGSLYFPA